MNLILFFRACLLVLSGIACHYVRAEIVCEISEPSRSKIKIKVTGANEKMVVSNSTFFNGSESGDAMSTEELFKVGTKIEPDVAVEKVVVVPYRALPSMYGVYLVSPSSPRSSGKGCNGVIPGTVYRDISSAFVEYEKLLNSNKLSNSPECLAISQRIRALQSSSAFPPPPGSSAGVTIGGVPFSNSHDSLALTSTKMGILVEAIQLDCATLDNDGILGPA